MGMTQKKFQKHFKGRSTTNIIKISVEVGRTSSVNFQSARNAVGFTATITEDEDPELETRRLQQKALNLLLGEAGDEDVTYDAQDISDEIDQLVLDQGFTLKGNDN